MVAIDKFPGLVDDQHAVGIPVKRDTDVRPHFPDFLDEGSRRGRTDIAVDIEAIRLDPDRNDVGAQFPQGFGGDPISGAIGAIDDDSQTVERKIAHQGTFGEFDIAGAIALNPHRAAEILRVSII